ncbi:hypothetical protein PQX77_022280 [Marasmius sp. AFHP31]|nr:hypothetical protein PQX77_022280 [Marasmius sp. AFHP31]
MSKPLLSLIPLASVVVACNPDFGGREVSIITKDGAAEWGWGSGGLQYQNADNESEFLVVRVLGFPALFPAYHIWEFNSTEVSDVIQGPRSHPPVLAWSGRSACGFQRRFGAHDRLRHLLLNTSVGVPEWHIGK